MKLFRICSRSALAAMATAFLVHLTLVGALSAQELGKGLVWAGQYVDREGETRTWPVQPLDVPKLEQAFAEIELHWQTTRDLEACDVMVDLLWLRVNDQRAEQVPNLLYQVFSPARARYLLSTGRPAAAKRALDQVLLPLTGLQVEFGAPQLMPPPEAATEEATSLLVCVNWRAARQGLIEEADAMLAAQAPPPVAPAAPGELERLLEELPAERRAFLERQFGLPGASMDREVQRMVQQGNEKGLGNLGLRAAPSLALRVLAELDDPASVDLFDPLEVLVRIDPDGAVALMDGFVEEAPQAWQFQVVEILGGRMHHNLEDGLWRDALSGWPKPADRYQALVAKLLRSDLIRPRALPLLRNLAQANALDAELIDLLGELLQALPERQAAELAAQLISNGEDAYPGTDALWDLLLLSSDRLELRQLAADVLYRTIHGGALWQAGNDVNLQIRLKSFQLLNQRTCGTWVWRSGSPRLNRTPINPVHNEDWLELLEARLAFMGNELDDSAIPILFRVDMASWRPHWNDLVLNKALADPKVAESLLRSDGLGDRRAETLLTLTESPNPKVLELLDERLSRQWDWHVDNGIGAQLLARRWDHPQHPFAKKADRPFLRTFFLNSVCHGQDGAAFILDFILGEGDAEMLARLAGQLWNEDRALNPFLVALRRLSPADRFRLLDLWPDDIHRNPLETTFLQPLVEEEGVDEWIAGIAAPSTQRSLLQRVVACQVAVRRGHPDAEALGLALLREPDWLPWSEEIAQASELCGFVFDDAERQLRFLDAVLEDPAIHEDMKLRALERFDPLDEEAAADLAERILTRWPDGPMNRSAIRRALSVLAQAPSTPARLALLHRAAAAGSLTATQGLAELRDPQLVPVFVAALKASADSTHERERLQDAAVEALLNIGDDQAALALAEALLWAETPEVRGRIQSALAALRMYREEIAYWRGEPEVEAAPSRDGALRELLAMLRHEDPALRIEAARSLAAFQVLESVPPLIRLLSDGDESVRAAAREALDRLQAGPAKAPPILF